MSADVTKKLLEALKGLLVRAADDEEYGPNHAVTVARVAIARAEAALAEPQPDADGWIPWAGGECPVLNMSRVDVVHRNGDIFSDGFAGYAQAKTWTHDNHPRDIIAYRIVRK